MIAESHKSADTVKALASKQGFDLVGITSADSLPQAHRNLLKAVKLGYTAGMAYLQRSPLTRSQPKHLAPWARSVICLAVNYHYLPLDSQPCVSRYALGSDYHLVLAEKLQSFSRELQKLFAGPFRSRMAVDTSPIMEKPLAQRAGLGWQGKNTLLINDRFGSWLFLAELITDLELAPDAPATNKCSQCRACIDACPTGALSEPGVLDSRKCLSYLTIESKGDLPPHVAQRLREAKTTGNCIYGCDICQRVCPFNSDTPQTEQMCFHPRRQLLNLRFDQLSRLSQAQFKQLFADTPVARLSYRKFRRNLQAIQP